MPASPAMKPPPPQATAIHAGCVRVRVPGLRREIACPIRISTIRPPKTWRIWSGVTTPLRCRSAQTPTGTITPAKTTIQSAVLQRMCSRSRITPTSDWESPQIAIVMIASWGAKPSMRSSGIENIPKANPTAL